MSEPTAPTARPDVDILDDIGDLILHYPPLANDRRHFRVDVVEGLATLTGHVKTPITHRYLVEAVWIVKGVKSVQDRPLYNDEAIRLEAGRVVPVGVYINVEYGTVVLSGRLPEGKTEADVVNALRSVPGVKRVVTALK